MTNGLGLYLRIAGLFSILIAPAAFGADQFRVATYNVETYLDQPTATRPFIKKDDAKAKVRESIKAMHPDVIALEEMGTTNALMELRASLKNEGEDFPYWEYVPGADPDIHVAILSKLPIVARRPHTNVEYLLDGKRSLVKRGFAEVDIQADANLTFTMLVAHLKSKRTDDAEDEEAMRLGEAKALHEIIETELKADPEKKMVVLGDFNDGRNSDPMRAIIGRGKFKLVDTRPAERNGDDRPSSSPRYEPRNVAWTHYYGVDDTYSRIDYILLSPAMAKDWLPAETYIPTVPNWGLGSDHRPITAAFDPTK
jgi:endonuclease/exonuclease/phosphatase family metal-dependent hydrolase